MAAITRSRLARGTKLTVQHAFAPLSAAATQLGANIEREQMAEPFVAFRLNFHMPILGGSITTVGASPAEPMQIPFTLPPPQDLFDDDGQQDDTDPRLILDEVMVSFDQRSEPAAVRDRTDGADGALDYPNVTNLNLGLRILEKRMLVFDSAAPFVPEREIFGIELPSNLWSGSAFRANPFLLTDLAIDLHPYRTYVLTLDVGDLARAAGVNLALVSFMVSLRIKTQLIARDTSAGNVQNIPTKHLGVKAPASVVIQTPTVNTTITADPATGVQTNLEVLDAEFVRKLRGGYDELSDVPPTEHLADDAAYEVIVVPMFGFGDFVWTGNIARLPYVGAAPYQGLTCDRRVIPIKFPLVIHHVLAVVNWARRASSVPGKPTAATFVTDIGVGMGVGFRADHKAYQQIAAVTFDPTTKGAYVVDRIKTPLIPDQSDGDYDMEILQVPLVYDNGGPFGNSYDLTAGGIRTGPPVFVGRAHTGTVPRTAIANAPNGTYATSLVGGQEQFLEVRWRFGDSVNGLGDAPTHPAGTTFIGYGGHWVLIFCKKHLA